MSGIKLKKIGKYILYIIFFNIIFSLFLFLWVTNDDIHNINTSDTPLNLIISLFYYIISTFTTTGYGDLYSTSPRMKVCIALYMILSCAILLTI